MKRPPRARGADSETARPPAPASRKPPSAKVAAGPHRRNRHQGRYDMGALLACSPDLAKHLLTTAHGERSIDFGRPAAVRALNAALLRLHYGIAHWQIPEGYLCPPVPGRADYLHGLADLLASDNADAIPRGAGVRVLDIGVGASAIYPLIGHAEYGWRFVGSDIDRQALASAQRILDGNPGFSAAIELRPQPRRDRILDGVLRAGEYFDLSMCNPPFHASADAAAQGSRRKWQNLGRSEAARGRPTLNFGGQANELWCPGGEAGFLRQMIAESAAHPDAVGWFSSLVAMSVHLRALRKQLQAVGALAVREVAMRQGNKQSRFLAWTFMDAAQRAKRRDRPARE